MTGSCFTTQIRNVLMTAAGGVDLNLRAGTSIVQTYQQPMPAVECHRADDIIFHWQIVPQQHFLEEFNGIGSRVVAMIIGRSFLEDPRCVHRRHLVPIRVMSQKYDLVQHDTPDRSDAVIQVNWGESGDG